MKIEIKDNTERSIIKKFEFPLNCEYSGDEEFQDVLKIFILRNTLTKVDEYLASDINNELGGVLIGDIGLSSSGDNFIVIDNLIKAKHTNSSISRLTFTHETWDYINQILEKDFPGKKILGWFHSHPGHTVFLSNYDMFIQENFFNMDYMVAYVYDPTINDRGFFSWANKKIIKSGGYYVCDISANEGINEFPHLNPENDLLEIDTPQKTESGSGKPDNKNFLTIGLLSITLLLLLFIIYNIYIYRQNALLKEEYENSLEIIKNENKELTYRLNEYIRESELKKKSLESEGNAGPEEPNTINANNIKYMVKTGDTIEKISDKFYKSKIGISLIMKQNNIKNKFDIKAGQELDLPNVKQERLE